MKTLYFDRLIAFSCLILLFTQACFEELDTPSPCYNLDALSVPQEVPSSEQGLGVNLVEYQYRYLKDQALHCEINSGSTKGEDACIEFYKEKLSVDTSNLSRLYTEFPGISCVAFNELDDKSYGYCALISPAESECSCYFNRDCDSNKLCYSNQLYLIEDCGDDQRCTRCLSRDEAPATR